MNYNIETFFPTTISTTQDIELFSQCNYKWFLRRCAYYTKYAYNVNLEAGREFAKAVEIVRVAYYKQGKSAIEAIELGRQNILQEYGKTYYEQDYPDALKTPEKLVEVLERMFKEHPLEYSPIVPFEMSDGTLSVEQEFMIELPFNHPETGKPLLLKGILDMIGVRDNIVFVVDEKTCKSVLTDRIKQLDLLRTQNQFVQNVTIANMNSEKLGGLKATHVQINKCKIKSKYNKGEDVVEAYEFQVDTWFQKTWWNNLLFILQDMLNKYVDYKSHPTFVQSIKQHVVNVDANAKNTLKELEEEVIFPRAYGMACTAFYSPCQFTYHCTSGLSQDLEADGFSQIVSNSSTEYKPVTLHKYKQDMLGGISGI